MPSKPWVPHSRQCHGWGNGQPGLWEMLCSQQGLGRVGFEVPCNPNHPVILRVSFNWKTIIQRVLLTMWRCYSFNSDLDQNVQSGEINGYPNTEFNYEHKWMFTNIYWKRSFHSRKILSNPMGIHSPVFLFIYLFILMSSGKIKALIKHIFYFCI